MKTKFMQAFEELDETSGDTSEDIGGLLLEQEEGASDISVMQDQVEEAEDTQEVLENMEAAATPEEAVCIAKEHMLSRIGYTSKVGMESFNASNEHFKAKLEGSIEFAQEGIASRVMDSIEFVFTSEDKVLKETQAALAKLDSSGSKETNIEEPGWGRYFSVGSKKEMSGQDVLDILTKYKALVTGSELKEACAEVVSLVEDSTAQYKKNVFIVGDEQIEKMKQNNVRLDELFSKIKGIINHDVSKKVDTSFDPLTAGQAKKVASEIETILNDKSFKEAFVKMKKAVGTFRGAFAGKEVVRGSVVSSVSSSGRAASKTLGLINSTLGSVNKVVGNKSKVCYAAMQYIKASTK